MTPRQHVTDGPKDAILKFEHENEVECFECNGKRFISVCLNDLCQGDEGCVHGDGNRSCLTCGGAGHLRASATGFERISKANRVCN